MTGSALRRSIDALRSLYHRLPEPPSTNYSFRKAVTLYELLPPGAVIYDIGSKEAGGTYAFGSPPERSRVVCIDIAPGTGVDLVADAHDMPMVPDCSVDCVVTISVLEHVRYPQRVVSEIYRILKPGGIVYVNVPFIFPYHSDPDDFYRFSCTGIEILCEKFEKIDSGFNRGPASTMTHLLVHFLAIMFSFNSQTLYGINVDVFKWLLFWIKYLDAVMGHYSMARVIHGGGYFVGRKP
jgi:SAM-dependent methyltransferase